MASPFGPCGCDDPIDPCCACDEPPEEFIVDFGAGGWTSTTCCDYCTQVAGEFSVPHQSGCRWFYTDLEACIWQHTPFPDPTCFGCPDQTMQFDIDLLLEDQEGDFCRYFVDVRLFNWRFRPPFTEFEECWDAQARAFYEVIDAPANIDCVDDEPIILTKTSEIHHGNMCAGSLPTTISVSRG